MRRVLIVAAALTATLVGAAATSGPAKGTSPMLTIRPANQDGDAYCVTCKGGQKPAIVAFLTANDEASQKLLTALSDQAKAGHDKHLTVTAIVIGQGQVPQSLMDYAKDEHLTIPVAVLSPDADGLDAWKLSDEVSNTVVFLNHHKVDHSASNLAADELAHHIHGLLGAH